LIGLVESVGDFYEEANDRFVFEVSGFRHRMHRPHTKDLSRSEVLDVRHFLARARLSPELPSQPPASADPAP
jgi:hypothetical protein